MDNIIKLLNLGGYSCVIMNDGQTRTFRQRGVADLYDLIENEPNFLHGALVADKVIGKAAASLMTIGGVAKVFTNVISQPALDVFNNAGIPVDYINLVPNIINRDKTGFCPLETLCINHATPTESLPVIRKFIAKIRSKTTIGAVLLSALWSNPFHSKASEYQNNTQEETKEEHSDKKIKTIHFNDIVITRTRNHTSSMELPVTVSVIDRTKLDNRLESSVLPSLNEYVPGFFSTSRAMLGYGVSTGSSGGMTMRGIGGSPTAGMLVLIDGHPQYMGLMGHPLADSYQSSMAEEVEVVRGPASVLYGSNAMGGVINIVTRKDIKEGVKTNFKAAYGSYNTLTSEFSNSVNKGKFSTVLTGFYNRSDNHRDNMDFEQYGGYARVCYNINKRWKTFADYNATWFNASNPGLITSPLIDNDSEILRTMASFSIENNYKHTSGALKLFYNGGKHNINDGYSESSQPLDYRFNSKDKMYGITWYQSASLFKDNRLTFGLDYQRFGGEAWNKMVIDNAKTPIIDKDINNIAGYLDIRQTLFSILTLNAGLRIDHHSVTGTEYIPQFGLSTRLSRSSALKAIASKGFRNPTIREMYMFPPQNPDLLPEKLWNYELSYTQSLLNNSLRYGLNLYYIKGDNLIQTVRTNGKPLNINTGEVENYGAEIDFSYRPSVAWRLLANYSWLNMKNPVVAAPEHKMYFEVGYFPADRFSITTGVQYIDGLYTSVSSENERKESFTLVNVRTSYQINSFINIFIKGDNLLGQRYEINAGYPMPKATVSGGFSINI